jgi:hypothetical protein
MNNKQLTRKIKRYIELRLEDRIYSIIRNKKIRILSKKNIGSIVVFMNIKKMYSISFLEYICNESNTFLPYIISIRILVNYCQLGYIEIKIPIIQGNS